MYLKYYVIKIIPITIFIIISPILTCLAQDTNLGISSLITINTKNDVLEKREKLIKILFGSDDLPLDCLPDDIEKSIVDTSFATLPNLKRIDKLTINMDWNLNSIAYHFIPLRSNKQMVIYHQGHNGKFSLGINTIKAFLDRGFTVIALSMPLKGMNRQPVVFLERFGEIKLVSHELMAFLIPKSGHPVK